MRVPLFAVACLVASTVIAPPARAWGTKEHVQLTRIAARRLLDDASTPEGLKAWLKQACPGLPSAEQERDYFLKARVGLFARGVDGLPYFATLPDAMAILGGTGENEKKVEPFGVGERALHYVDLERFVREEPRQRYRHDLSNKPSPDVFWDHDGIRRHQDGVREVLWQKAGMLPFRVDQCYAQLVRAFREGRLADKPGQLPRDEHAVKWAGYLAHYVQDNTQPQHATEDFNSRYYFADKRNAPNVNWDFTGRLSDDEEADYPELRAEFWDALGKALAEVEDPVESEDLRGATIEVAMLSYDALPLIGTAAMRAYDQHGTPEKPEGPVGKFDATAFFHATGKYQGREMTLMEMKARQMAWGVKRCERLWLRAWDEAHRPPDAP